MNFLNENSCLFLGTVFTFEFTVPMYVGYILFVNTRNSPSLTWIKNPEPKHNSR
jgi:hypothetical protein